MFTRFAGWAALMVLAGQGRALAVDVDGDGVADEVDVCCQTPPGIAVDGQGRPRGDLDNDCDVDQTDFGLFQANMTGSFSACTPSPEVCDGIDNDCNCHIDDHPSDGATWYPDQDGDGYGATPHPVRLCSDPGAGYTQQPGDCNDFDDQVSPTACNDQCTNFSSDPEHCVCINLSPGAQTCGLGVCLVTTPLCNNGQPVTCVPNSGAASPEVCDNIDNDCDGGVDEDWNRQTDVNHCGTSCTVCINRPNSTRVCTGGVCGFTCNAGFGDCDGLAANGCERNLESDDDHCGTCGHQCGTLQLCRSGVCR